MTAFLALRHDRVCQQSRGDIVILAVNLYGAIFKPFDVSPRVSAAYDRQHRAAIKFLGLMERSFISINAFGNDVVARQLEKVIHSRVSGFVGNLQQPFGDLLRPKTTSVSPIFYELLLGHSSGYRSATRS